MMFIQSRPSVHPPLCQVKSLTFRARTLEERLTAMETLLTQKEERLEVSFQKPCHTKRVYGRNVCMYVLCTAYANVQCKKNGLEGSRSFTLDTSTGSSPSPTSPCPPMQEEPGKEKGVVGSDENIYTPVSQNTLDYGKWYLAS